MIDGNTGTWRVSGQGTIGSNPLSSYGSAAILPAYAQINLVRLTFAYQCIHSDRVDEHCPAKP